MHFCEIALAQVNYRTEIINKCFNEKYFVIILLILYSSLSFIDQFYGMFIFSV